MGEFGLNKNIIEAGIKIKTKHLKTLKYSELTGTAARGGKEKEHRQTDRQVKIHYWLMYSNLQTINKTKVWSQPLPSYCIWTVKLVLGGSERCTRLQ